MIFHYYCIENKITNKKYIGITEKTVKHRYSNHCKLLRAKKHPNYKLQKDWNDYGEESFTCYEIEEIDAETVEIGYNHEKDLIQSYNTVKDGYNILIGGKINPIYTTSVYNKMTNTWQSSVPNIYQLKEIAENVFEVVGIYRSQKEAGRLTNKSQSNIQKALKTHNKGNGYYWIEESELKNFEQNWKPNRTKICPCARLNENGEIVEVHHNRSIFEKKYNFPTGSLQGAIARNGRYKGIKYIDISLEEYYSRCPVTLKFEPVSTIPFQKEVD